MERPFITKIINKTVVTAFCEPTLNALKCINGGGGGGGGGVLTEVN